MLKKPNILLITTDQQRYDTVKPWAPSFMRTPHYDILANEGISFLSCYSQCPICVPTRISLMAGREPQNIKHLDNSESSKVLGREKTLPNSLRSLGYQTIAVGKMHFGPQRVRHGFDEMILPEDYYKEMRTSGSMYQPMKHGLGQNELYPTMATVPESMTLTSWTAEKCVEYILDRRDPTLPFFMWCSFAKPHPPLDPPEPYYSMYRNCNLPDPFCGDWSDEYNCPESFKRHRQSWHHDIIAPEIIKEARSAYLGLVTQIDYNMGRIFGALNDDNLLNDTLIIYTSDHGELLGDHHACSKMFFYETAAHVPFVLKLPKNWNNRMNGTCNNNVITHSDILPTLISAAGGEIPKWAEGQNLISLARGELKEPREYLLGIAPPCDCKWTAVTDGRWKYIYYPEGSYEQLFDLEEDPKELTNLLNDSKYLEKIKELRRVLIKLNKESETEYVKDDELVQTPIMNDTVKERRNNYWHGIFTDNIQDDVRH